MATMGKAMAIAFFFCCFFVTLLSSSDFALGKKSEKKVYNVGDAAGWTILGDVNYTAWASSKTFHVGDTIVFVYNKQFHNVMEVKKAEYRSCSTSSPLATYTTGDDSVVMRRGGHHFFICGVPGHCAAGQRVDIRIPKLNASSTPPPPTQPPTSTVGGGGPSQPPTPTVGGGAPVPAPKSNHAASNKGPGAAALAVVAVAAAVAVAVAYCTL